MMPGAKIPPAGLGERGQQLWHAIMASSHISEPHRLLLLEQLCRCAGRLDALATILAGAALISSDRFGQSKAHPAAALEATTRAQLLDLVRALALPSAEQAALLALVGGR